MKYVLVGCDACGKVVPEQAFRGWWGLNDSGGPVPNFSFVPLTKKKKDYSRHLCSQECLMKFVQARAESVDMKKVSVFKEPEMSSYSLMSSLMLGMPSAPDTSDSIGYYGKPKKEDEEAEDDAA